MVSNYFNHIIVFLFLFSISQSLDNSTLSNYQNIKITNLEGIFEPDFKQKIVKGSLTYYFVSLVEDDKIILDTKNLSISSITNYDTKESIPFKYGQSNEYLGDPLIISLSYEQGQKINLTINYTTTEEGSSAQFLTKEQTIGGKYEYFFTMSEMIVGRELLPSQDTPAIKFPFYLGIKVPNPLYGMISGIFVKTEDNEDDTKTFYYKQEIPIPNYLIALAAGNIKEREINKIISVFSEPEFVDKVYEELHDFLPFIIEKAISYMGEYEWGKYNVLVLPKSFPYSGMENPCLSFCSPCLINGDKSLVDIVAHELIHSWSGNLVTNENWSDFWLNEGVTMFLQRKVISMWKGEDYAKMDSILGLFYIEEYLDMFGEDSIYTTLRPDFKGQSPDDFYSDIPYEKGYNLLYFIESLIGNETMQNFFQSYFVNFKYQSVNYYDFKNYFIEFCQNNNVTNEILDKIDWDAWIFSPGKCPVENNFTNKYSLDVDEALEKFINEEIDEDLKNKFNSWIHTSKTVFMNTLEQRNEFLTEKQHDFLTNKLELYKGQNFLIETNYLRLILAKTDRFYEHEKDSLIEYLSNNGAMDYMTGIYKLFYQRDEVLAEEVFNNLTSFYHSLMIKEIEEEFQSAKEDFPILSLNLKKENECSFISLETKLEIESDEYTDSFDSIEIEKGVYLKSEDNETIELQCHLDPKEKYCNLKNEIENSGIYNLNVPIRIQNQSFAIKMFEGNKKIQIYTKDILIDETKTKKDYNINFKANEKQMIEIYFLKVPDENVKIVYEEKDVECELKNLTMECTLDNNIFDLNEKDLDKNKSFKLKILDLCGTEKYSFNVIFNIKKKTKEKEEEGDSVIKTVILIVIIVVGVLVVLLIAFLIYRKTHRKNNKDIEKNEGETEPENSNKLMSDY